jgi:putative ABC transport system ATP-binding protein
MDDTKASLSTDPIIALDGVTLTLASGAGAVNILRGINLSVAAGESVSVMGPSGAGKTSLMMIVGGLEQATGGTVRVAGHLLGSLDEDALALFRRDNMGIVFQDFHLIPTMTALENVSIPLELAGRRDAAERAAAGLESVGLGHRMTHYPGQLSGGEQQRVALARAFAAGPRLLLADEPTGNLDHDTGQVIVDLLFRLSADHGTTIVLITHEPALAERCGRRIRLEDGLIVADSGAPVASVDMAAQ